MKKALLIIIIVLLSYNKSNAQGTAGKDFWVAFMAQDWGCYYNTYYYNNDTAELFLSSQYAATVYIAAKGQNFYDTIRLTPNETSMVRLPREVVCRYSDTVTTNGVHVRSDTTINVFAVNRYWFSKGATVVIPSSSIINAPEYIITTAKDNYSWGWSCNGKQLQSPEFTIVGIADSSVIEIVPTGASSRNSPKNVPFQITLKKGETFQYMTTDQDLTGSFIRTKYLNSKFAVFAGNRQNFSNRSCSSGNCNSSWDHTYEQLIPTVTWGRNYTSLPFKNNSKGYTLKVVAAENNTVVNINGSYYATLNQSEFFTYEVCTADVVRIKGSNRISVAQFALGGYNCQNHPTKSWIGDPSQLQLFPDEQFGNNATINTVSQNPWWWNWSWSGWWQLNSPEHYINVLTKTVDTSFFSINGKKIRNNNWITSSNLTDYHYTQIQIDTGSHHMTSSKGFLSYVYGYGYYDGYAYAAAAKFSPIQNNFIIINAQCVRDSVNFRAVKNDSFSNFKWKIQGRNGLLSGDKMIYKFPDTGWYEVKMYCNHVITNALDSVTKVLYVADTKIKSLLSFKDSLICGKVDYIEISKGFNMDNEYRWMDGWDVYYRAIKAPSTYWLEVMERNGCTYRDTMIVRDGKVPQSNFSLSDTQFCFNTLKNVKFTNKSKSVDSVDFYVWNMETRKDTIYSKDSVLSHKFSRANTHPVILRTQTKKGCYHDTFMIVEVLHSPKSQFEFTQKDTCFESNRIQLKNNTIINKDFHQRYRWRFSDGNNLSNNNPGPRKYADTGKYSILLIYDNNNGCSDTNTQFVNIKPNPDANFSFVSGIYCSLDSIKFTANTSSPYVPLSHEWKFSDASSLNGPIVNKSFSGFGTYRIQLKSTAITGCTDTISQSIFVNGSPVVDFEINNDTQCLFGHQYAFTNKTLFNNTLQYEWNFGDNTSSTDSNILNKTYSKDSTYNVRLKATTNVGCFASVTKPVYLGKYPTAGFNILDNEQCLRNNSFDFVNQSFINKGNISKYNWQLGDFSNSNLKDVFNKQYLSDDTLSVQLIVSSNLGCNDTIQKSIVVYPQPNAQFTVNKTQQCFNEQIFEFLNNSQIKNETLQYTWQFGDNTTSSIKDPSKKYNQTGQYQVSLIARSQNNCIDTSDLSNLVVDYSPIANFSIDKNQQCFKNNAFNFTNSSQLMQGTITDYLWSMGDNNLRNTANISQYRYISEDTFDVTLVVKTNRNCFDTISKMAVTFAQPNIQFNIPNDTQCWQNNTFVLQNKTKLKYGNLVNRWLFGDNTFSNQYQPNEKRYPNTSASYTVKYNVNTEHGCRDSATTEVHLLERPIAKFAINDSIQCFNTHNYSFTNNTTFSILNTLSYNWDYGNGVKSSGIQALPATYPSADFYPLQLIVSSSLTNCYDTSSQNIVVAPMPQVDFTINNDSQCYFNHAFVFNNTSLVKFGNLSFKWLFEDGTNQTSTDAAKKYSQENYSKVKLIAESNYNCIDSTQKITGFYATPRADFNINDNVQCVNNNLFNFSNTSQLSRGTFTQKWSISDGSISNNLNFNNKIFKVNDTQSIQLVVITNKGCTDTILKKVYVEKDENFSINNLSDLEQCLRQNRFGFSFSKNLAKINIQQLKWNMGDAMEYNAPSVQHSYNNDSQFLVQLIINTDNNCKDTSSVLVTTHVHPNSDFTTDAVCFPEPNEFANLSNIKKGTIVKNEWTMEDQTNYTSFEPSHRFKSAGIYNVKLISTSDFGCTDTLSKTKVALVKEKPLASFNFSQLKTIVADETRLQMQNQSSLNSNSFIWQFYSQGINTDKNPIVSFQDTGNFPITLVAFTKEGCSDTLTRYTGSVFPDFNIYIPNAFSPDNNNKNEVYKVVGSKYVYKFKMSIYNRWGEKVFETTNINEGWDGKYKGSACMEGTYLVKIDTAPFNGPFRSYEQAVLLLR